MTDLSLNSYYFSIEVYILVGKVVITKKTYFKKLLKSHQITNCNQSSTPMVEGLNLQPRRTDFTSDPTDVTVYKKFTGSVQWLTYQTRPDSIQTVSKLSLHNVKFIEECWKVVIYLLRYIKGTKNKAIRYANKDLIPFGDSNSSWVDDLFDRKSSTGYFFIFNGRPISWTSYKQLIVSTSTCEAE